MKYRCIDPGAHKRLVKGAEYDGEPFTDDCYFKFVEITFDDDVQIAYAARRFQLISMPETGWS